MKYFIIITFAMMLMAGCKKETFSSEATPGSDIEFSEGIIGPMPAPRWTKLPTNLPNTYPYGDPTIMNMILPVGNDIYMLSGSLGEYVYKFNKATQKFQTHTPTNNTGTGFGIFYPGHKYLFNHGGKIYAGLADNGSDTSFFFTIDPVTSVVTSKARFPGVKTIDPVSFSIGNKGYVISGFNSSTPSQVWEYDFTANSWTNKGLNPLGKRYGFNAVVINDKVYMGLGYERTSFNGQNINIFKKDWISYTPGSAWSAVKASFPGGGRLDAQSYVLNGLLFLGLGRNGGSYKDFWKYNPDSDSWSQQPDWTGTYGNNDVGYYSGKNVSLFTDGDVGYAVKGASNGLWRYSSSSLVIQ